MSITLAGMSTDISLLQPENALGPILDTPWGMVQSSKLLQPQNALPPMDSKLDGRVSRAKSEQSPKA